MSHCTDLFCNENRITEILPHLYLQCVCQLFVHAELEVLVRPLQLATKTDKIPRDSS